MLELIDAVAVLDATNRIDGDDELAAAGRAGVGLVSFAGLEAQRVSEKGAGQQFNHHRNVGALEAAERELGTGERPGRVGGWFSVRSDRPSFGEQFPVAETELDFATGAGAGGLIENQRWLVGTRPGKCHWVGAEQRLGTSSGRHVGTCSNEREADKTPVGQPLHLRPKRRHVQRIVHDQGGDAVLRGSFGQRRVATFESEWRESVFGVDLDDAWREILDGRFRVRRGLSG